MELSDLGWADLVFLVSFLFVLYISIKQGLLSGVLKLAGLFFASFFALHNYPAFADAMTARLSFINQDIARLAGFSLILACIMVPFFLLRRILVLLLKKEEYSRGERWLACLVGGIRFFLLAGVVCFMYTLLPGEPARGLGGVSYRLCKDVAPDTYRFCYGAFYRRLFPESTINKEVEPHVEVEEDL